MQFRAYASIAIFVAGAMAASTTSSASAAVSTPVDLTAGVPTCGLTCIQSAVSASGCEATDPVCLCTTGSKAFLTAGTTCLLQNSDCSAEDLQNIQSLAKSRCATLLTATGSSASGSSASGSSASGSSASGSSASGSSASGSAAASVSSSATVKAAAVSGSASSSVSSAVATQTGGAMQFGASLMAVGAGALAFVL